VAAVLIQGEPGVCHPMADPAQRAEELLHDMAKVVESEFSIAFDDGRTGCFLWVQEGDARFRSRGARVRPASRGAGH